MADTVDTGLLPRTYFKAPRVPFDFRGVAIAIIGYLVYWAGGWLLSKLVGVQDVPGTFLVAASTLFDDVPFLGQVIPWFLETVFRANPDPAVVPSFWHVLLGGIWFIGVWSFFGQAIHRIASLRIARDEGLTLFEAFQFAAKNWPTVLLAPVIIGAAIAFFWFCNALGGLLISIPVAGELLSLLIVPLAVISTLLILLIALGGIFGVPLIGAAAAWERNGSLDAISRAFSYIFARPLQFFWNYFLIFLFVGVILLVGSWFTWTLTKSVGFGAVSETVSVAIDAPAYSTEENSDYVGLSTDGKKLHGNLTAKTGLEAGRSAPYVQPFAGDIRAVGEMKWYHVLSTFVFWAFLSLIQLGIFGYAVFWFLGASTSVYADLRADVDGTEEDEIYLEEEEEDFDAFSAAVDKAEPEPTTDEGQAASGDADSASADDAAKDGDAPTSDDGEDKKTT